MRKKYVGMGFNIFDILRYGYTARLSEKLDWTGLLLQIKFKVTFSNLKELQFTYTLYSNQIVYIIRI